MQEKASRPIAFTGKGSVSVEQYTAAFAIRIQNKHGEKKRAGGKGTRRPHTVHSATISACSGKGMRKMFKFKKAEKRAPTFIESILTVGVLVVLIALGFLVFNWPVAMMMIAAAIFAALMAMRCGYTWKELEKAISTKFASINSIILILFFLGAVVASFVYSGTIPYIVSIAIKILNPKLLYVVTFLACALMSSATGGSWSTAATMGMAMFGVAVGMNANLTVTAAAAICGSFFGDKMSPISETTNLAPLCAGSNLYEHIGSMLWTTVPTAVVCIVVYLLYGTSMTGGETPETAVKMLESLNSMFKFNIILLIPFVIIIVAAIVKAPALPTMVLATISALLLGAWYQGFSFADGLNACLGGCTPASLGISDTSGYAPEAVSLVTKGGMKGMAGTIITVFSGYVFASIVSHVGFMQKAVSPILKICRKNRFTLVLGTLVTDGALMALGGSSYPAHIISGEMFRKEYAEMGIDARVLSRTMEDFGTVGSPLIPWTGSGAYMAGLFGIAAYGAGGFAPLAIQCWLTSIVALILAATGIGMYPMSEEKKKEVLEALEKENSTEQ